MEPEFHDGQIAWVLQQGSVANGEIDRLDITNSLIAPIIVHFLWNSVGAIILGGVSLAEDYPHLFNMTFGGNQLLSGGIYKIEGSVVVFVLNVIMIIGFIMAKKKKNIA